MFGEPKLSGEMKGEAGPSRRSLWLGKRGGAPMGAEERPLKCSPWAAAWAQSKHCTGLPLC